MSSGQGDPSSLPALPRQSTADGGEAGWRRAGLGLWFEFRVGGKMNLTIEVKKEVRAVEPASADAPQ